MSKSIGVSLIFFTLVRPIYAGPVEDRQNLAQFFSKFYSQLDVVANKSRFEMVQSTVNKTLNAIKVNLPSASVELKNRLNKKQQVYQNIVDHLSSAQNLKNFFQNVSDQKYS